MLRRLFANTHTAELSRGSAPNSNLIVLCSPLHPWRMSVTPVEMKTFVPAPIASMGGFQLPLRVPTSVLIHSGSVPCGTSSLIAFGSSITTDLDAAETGVVTQTRANVGRSSDALPSVRARRRQFENVVR
jgi:hypothetical protein